MSLENQLKVNAKEEKHLKDLKERCELLRIEVEHLNDELDSKINKVRKDTYSKISEVMK